MRAAKAEASKEWFDLIEVDAHRGQTIAAEMRKEDRGNGKLTAWAASVKMLGDVVAKITPPISALKRAPFTEEGHELLVSAVIASEDVTNVLDALSLGWLSAHDLRYRRCTVVHSGTIRVP